jgi:hypothetical protein
VEVSLPEILKTVGDAGVLGLLILILYGLTKKWWVVGWAYEEVRKERDEWKELALSGTRAAERAVDLAQQGRKTTRPKAVAEE